MTQTGYRLSRSVVPTHYAIDLDASPRRTQFHGALTLSLRVLEATDTIELHARALRISEVRVRTRRATHKGRVTLYPDRETVVLSFDDRLLRGPAELLLHFRGALHANMHGLYLARDGAERAVVSQCEATDARAIFPCFDEPDFKAPLQWTVRTDPGLEVITNGVLARRRVGRSAPKRDVHEFRATRPVSSYLAALTIGRYEAGKARRVRGVRCQAWAARGKAALTEFAQEVTAYALPWYEDYFAHRYHFQKLDQVAVAGFDAGAMENIGAIFYRQNLLLMEPGATSWYAQKRIAEVIAHEIAHQWFGNLVTMRWWDDLWLNEAFATWIAYKAVDTWRPEWRLWDDYQESKEAALGADALTHTHAIYTPVASPAEATELFDVITYEKGCAVLRMAESFLGEDRFRDGMRRYVGAYRLGNARGSDLWTSLREASGEPVDALMESWINQPGFPLVTVKATGATLHLRQQRFSLDPEAEASPQRWLVPVLLRYDRGDGAKVERVLLRDSEVTVALPGTGDLRWLHANADAAGFYRVQLDDDLRQRLLRQGLGTLTASERVALLTDHWALVWAGKLGIAPFLDVLAALRGEMDHVVVRAMVRCVQSLHDGLVRDSDRDALRAFVGWLFGADLERAGRDPVPGEPPQHAVRRAAWVGALGEYGRDAGVLAWAAGQVDAEEAAPRQYEANLAMMMTQLAALCGNGALLDRYVSIFLARKAAGAAPELQARYLGAFSAFESPRVLPKVLQLCLDGTVPQEQLRAVLVPMLARPATGRACWLFLKRHWKTLSPKIGAMGIARLVEATSALPLDLRGDIAAFFAAHPVAEAQRAIKKSLEAMDLRRKLVEREAAALGEWLTPRVSAVRQARQP